nr:hypothetical protein [uncultured Pedobacter sp.]
MYTTHFLIYPVGTFHPQLCRVDIDDETYNITIEGNTIGWMERDYSVDYGFTTDNPEVLALLPDLTEKLKEIQLAKDFGIKIKTVWGPNIISTEYIEDDKLIVIVNKDTDLDEFGNVVKDVVLDYVEFEEHLDLILQKDGTEETFIVGIN